MKTLKTMKNCTNLWKKRIFSFIVLALTTSALFSAIAQETGTPLRRPISASSPVWFVHIDSWNEADPAKIIDLIPKDILPYVVFNISLSINWDGTAQKWLRVRHGYECAKSWLRVCAEKGAWAMIQPASGGQTHFPDLYANAGDPALQDQDFENSWYGEFFRDYPNFLGFNYCEQFWGFDQTQKVDAFALGYEAPQFTPSPVNRYKHFAGLLRLCNKYGGYLAVSWCGNEWSPNINPLAMLKRVPEWRVATQDNAKNYIIIEKFTQATYLFDKESLVLGQFLSGYAGNFGVRYDETGWTDSYWSNDGDRSGSLKTEYTLSSGFAAHVERMLLNGATVIDGPELIWVECFNELGMLTVDNNYQMRRWKKTDQFNNFCVSLFRKIINGAVRIPTREEVIDRTKLIIINNVTSGSNDAQYSSPLTIFKDIYAMNIDYGNGWSGAVTNHNWNHIYYKSNGRYPTIPVAYGINRSDPIAIQGFKAENRINQSTLGTRWPDTAAKQAEFNNLFPADYGFSSIAGDKGDIYAARYQNTWVTYNPFTQADYPGADGTLNFKYNTCDRMELDYSIYAGGIITEKSNSLEIYLNNFDNRSSIHKNTRRTNVIRIYGSSAQPAMTFTSDGTTTAPSVVENWADNVYTITVTHNGPVNIKVNCSGTATDRLTTFDEPNFILPPNPPAYTGPRQYEAENFDRKSISKTCNNGAVTDVHNFTGMGYIIFGVSSAAAVRDTVYAVNAGLHTLNIKYSVVTDENDKVDLYVNGTKVTGLMFSKTANTSTEWAVLKQQINLKKGANTVELRGKSLMSTPLYLDNFVLEGDFTEPTNTRDVTKPAATVKYEEYYTIMGYKVDNPYKTNSTGIFIVKSVMSDGSVTSRKICISK